MNITAHQVVDLDRNVAAPRGPNAVWLPDPPKAPARSAASPLCSRITAISTRQTTTCNVTRNAKIFQPIHKIKPRRPRNEIAHFTSLGISSDSATSDRTLEIHNGRKLLRVQACAADQRPINLGLRHQPFDVVGFDAAAVKDPQRGGTFRR